MFTRSKQKIISWTAIALLLLTSFAPSLTHALAAASRSSLNWQQICSASAEPSTKSSGGPVQKDSVVQVDHCAYCLTCALNDGVPPRQDRLSSIAEPDHALLFAANTAWPLHQPPLWIAPHSRAPPELP